MKKTTFIPGFMLFCVLLSACNSGKTPETKDSLTSLDLSKSKTKVKVPECNNSESNPLPLTNLVVDGLGTSYSYGGNTNNRYTIHYSAGDNKWLFQNADGSSNATNDELTFTASATDENYGIRHVEVRVIVTQQCGNSGTGYTYKTIDLKPKAQVPSAVPVGQFAPKKKTDTYVFSLNDLFTVTESSCGGIPISFSAWTLAYNNNPCPGILVPFGFVEASRIDFELYNNEQK